MKTYLKLDAFDLGVIVVLINQGDPDHIPRSLKKKVQDAVNQVYLDSGFSKEEVFGKKK